MDIMITPEFLKEIIICGGVIIIFFLGNLASSQRDFFLF